MSFLRGFSGINNLQAKIDRKPSQGSSNMFKSGFFNLNDKDISVNFSSNSYDNAFFNTQGISLIDKISTNSKQNNPTVYHYNWIVCKNGGLSEQQGDEDEQSQNILKNDQQENVNHQHQMENQVQKCALEHKKVKNQTKNIPKNYGKAIICFIEKNQQKISKITQNYGVNYFVLLEDLKKKKKRINTIADLRQLWSEYKFKKCMRVISYQFLRKYSLNYIFSSRICTFASHIKYRQRLCQAVSNPEQFNHIKQF